MFYYFSAEIENIFNVWREPGICNKPPKGYIPLTCLSSRKLNLRECIHIAKGILESLNKLHRVDIAQNDLALADVYIRALKVNIITKTCLCNIQRFLSFKN